MKSERQTWFYPAVLITVAVAVGVWYADGWADAVITGVGLVLLGGSFWLRTYARRHLYRSRNDQNGDGQPGGHDEAVLR